MYEEISREVFRDGIAMERVYEMFRICLQMSRKDERFSELKEKIMETYHNENLEKMNAYYSAKVCPSGHRARMKPQLLEGDAEETLKSLSEKSVQLILTSPPYYNAREYSNYRSYAEYLEKMKGVFTSCSRVIEDGRFAVVNVSPVITKRAGREFESIRYPIHYDFHRVLTEAGFYFVDEIIWIKPEPSVPDRIGGYRRTRKPLSYKPNCITESLMVYRRNCNFLLDVNMREYKEYDRHEDEGIDTTNCWRIAPKHDVKHPAVFPEELCRRVLKYYSFEGDTVLDPFAGSGTTGRVAEKMKRIPILCEINEDYAKRIREEMANL